ncbi:endonuclease domain-containing protein [Pseudarthrobacter sp. J1738]|uniref:endonuclease domain-containing protein n=1 Tax=unclassified Pseudarthrobacter TaxID=2647000 RepID=UPI003D276798
MRKSQLPEHLQGVSFALRASDKSGVSRGRTRAKDLMVVSRGIRLPTQTQPRGAAAVRAYTELDESSILSHVSAARLWEMPLPASLSGDWRLHIARRAVHSVPRRANTVGHLLTLAAGEDTEVDGVRLTSAPRTWLDMASTQTTMEDLVVMGDHLVCSHGPEFPAPREAVCSIDDLRQVVDAHPGARGIRKAREALNLVRVGADSAPESRMRLALVQAGLPEPALNLVVFDDFGRPIVWPDAAYLEHRVALQYDGGHHGDEVQYLRDIRRAEASAAHGWLEVRVSQHDLTGERPGVVLKVRRALESRAELALRAGVSLKHAR